jgi:hypothetical protein
VTRSNAAAVPSLAQLLTTHTSGLVPGEQIVGLAYRIKATAYTYTDEGERINIAGGVFSPVPYVSGNKFYTITLSNANDYSIFTVGDKVKLFSHASTPDISNVEATVTQKIVENSLSKIQIQLPQGIDLSNVSNGGNTGYITIQNTFIIAKGRIL